MIGWLARKKCPLVGLKPALSERWRNTWRRREPKGILIRMYALALIRYRRPIEEVVVHQEGHRAFQRKLKEDGYTVVGSGPPATSVARSSVFTAEPAGGPRFRDWSPTGG